MKSREMALIRSVADPCCELARLSDSWASLIARELGKNFVLGAEIGIDERLGDIETLRDLVECGLAITLVIEQVDRSRDNAFALQTLDRVAQALRRIG
jgi:hypothetical protein